MIDIPSCTRLENTRGEDREDSTAETRNQGIEDAPHEAKCIEKMRDENYTTEEKMRDKKLHD